MSKDEINYFQDPDDLPFLKKNKSKENDNNKKNYFQDPDDLPFVAGEELLVVSKVRD